MKIKIMIIKYLITVLTNLKTIHVSTFFFVKLKASTKLGVLVSPFFFATFQVAEYIQTFTIVQGVKEYMTPTFFENGMFKDMYDWYFGNLSYITIVGFAVIIDHGLGTWKHLIVRDFSMKKNVTGLMTKIGLVVACGILFEGLNVIIQKDSFVKEYLTIVTRLIVFLYPAGSAFGNSTFLSNGKFPPQSWLDRLKSFQTNLNPSELKKSDDENESGN